ncbi:acyltransferase family protein [Mycolicibacterium sp. F2034L]|uniref:acyltransferase family protein n=1 Tax=Mycolicibacterium sp. F2034L TaxID=2926422 RepID=UPI001FF632C7|nr:acyltransferase family protein [Mycolicibacterium sp. F2034L]MCK0174821.1 acyltransferase [Mycolicibacterium sp. F2034L]
MSNKSPPIGTGVKVRRWVITSGGEVTSVLKQQSRRRQRRVRESHQRLDIQGLRMVAVLTVFAFHLFGWPRGGFVGVDVFFVISGFLITGNLLRQAETSGNVSFKQFYWNRVRRIVPAATVVLLVTYVASLLVFQSFRAHQVGLDALAAFFFAANWYIGSQETDYFAADATAVSPIQHYWSLSIEEQFYFVWPAIIFAIGIVIARKAWTHSHRMRIAAMVMAGIVALSLGWSLLQTFMAPAWAYFDTLARVWELGVGALLATAVGLLARIPVAVKPWLSWGGLGLIAASLFLIGENSVGFPAPWALLPVAGAAMVIAAGVQEEPQHQAFLQNQVSVYIGNISYSLYLVHWPVIVILGSVVRTQDITFDLMVIALTFGLSIASYHFIENPLRRADRHKAREAFSALRQRRFEVEKSTRNAGLAVLVLVTVALASYAIIPPAQTPRPPEAAASARDADVVQQPQLGPLGSALRQRIQEATLATEWPELNPSVETVIDTLYDPEIEQCGNDPNPQQCTWGSPTAPTRVMLVGDSIAIGYAESLRDIALASEGRIQLRFEALAGCRLMINYMDDSAGQELLDTCLARRQQTIQAINDTKPDVVLIANAYNDIPKVGDASHWADLRRQIVDQFRGSTGKLVWLSPAPDDKSIADCYGIASSVPADCLSEVTDQWLTVARTEQMVAEAVGGVWIDSRPWFCTDDGLCPAFVGTTVTKRDKRHPSKVYADELSPVIAESLAAAGVF